MAFTPQLLGKAAGTNLTDLSINTSGIFSAGGKVYGVVTMDRSGPDDFVDSEGNVYVQVGLSQNAGISAALMQCASNLRLPNNSTITATAPAGWNGAIGAFGISGLTSGVLHRVSGGQGTNNLPLVALSGLSVNDWVLAVVGVQAPSSNTFTQGSGFTNPGNFNTQITTDFSTYAGFMQATAGGHVEWRPSLATPATWAAVMLAVAA